MQNDFKPKARAVTLQVYYVFKALLLFTNKKEVKKPSRQLLQRCDNCTFSSYTDLNL